MVYFSSRYGVPSRCFLFLVLLLGSNLLPRILVLAQSPLNQFLPPIKGQYAGNADLVNVTYTNTIEDCANLCLNYTGPSYSNLGCISFNICTETPPYRCGIQGFNRSWTFIDGSSCSFYQLLRPRNDTLITQAIPWQLAVPTGQTVTLLGNNNPVYDMFMTNIDYLLNNYNVDDILYNFRKRAGVPNPPNAKCHGWDCNENWVEGSIAALFLMGSGNILQHYEHPQLRSMMNEVVQGIANCTQSNGFIMAFPETFLNSDEHPDYTLSWTTHGLLAAHAAGNPQALPLIRGMMNLFNNHTSLPTFLPPDGGNAPFQTPVDPPPSGWNGVNCSGYGSKWGHTIYLIMQGIIHSTRMALSEVGTQADLDLVLNLYQEPWWIEFLSTGDPASIWQKHWFSHNYEMTAFEAYMDLYILTGNLTYLNAINTVWNMWKQSFMHVGGSAAINEVQYYPPGSYFLTAQDPNPQRTRYDVLVAREHNGYVAQARADQRFAMELLRHAHAHPGSARAQKRAQLAHHQAELSATVMRTHEHATHDHHHHFGADWGNHPTGEFCGAVFWTKLNQRYHRLYPDNETYVNEIENVVFNEGLAHQGINGTGIRYFSNLNGVKEDPGTAGTCCEGQGTRLYGSLPEFIYSLPLVPLPSGVYVDLYVTSSIVFNSKEGNEINLTTTTSWPYGNDVKLTINVPSTSTFDVALRMPSWVTSTSIPVTMNNPVNAYTGIPGTYLHLAQTWTTGITTVSFTLPMNFTTHPYTGVTIINGYQRYAYTYGPILLGLLGPFNTTLDVIVLPSSINPLQPETWMIPANDGNSLHFSILDNPGYTFIPYGEISAGTEFSVYPAYAQ